MWDPRLLTTLQASTAWYGESFAFAFAFTKTLQLVRIEQQLISLHYHVIAFGLILLIPSLLYLVLRSVLF
jgi:hypothetical protein